MMMKKAKEYGMSFYFASVNLFMVKQCFTLLIP